MKMVQENYQHYLQIYDPTVGFYRNDFALTFALRMVNGQTEDPKHYIPWTLTHVPKDVTVTANNNHPFNTSYTLLYDNRTRYKVKKEFINIKDMDFHMMNKENFMEVV